MWKNFLSFLGSLSVLGYLSSLSYLGSPVFAQEGSNSLLVTSQIIRVNQGFGEEETFYYGILEEMEIENRGPVPYQKDLVFWVGEGEDLQAAVVQVGDNEVNLEIKEIKVEEGLVYLKLKEGVFIRPGKVRVGLDYKVFFVGGDENKGKVFEKKILYPHAQGSLQFKVNPIENLGFRPQLEGFAFKKDENESGWFVSPLISPQQGNTYRLNITRVAGQEETEGIEKEGEILGAGQEEAVKGVKGREPVAVGQDGGELRIRLFSDQVGEWTWKEILAIFLLNDILIFGLIGWKHGWFKDSGLGQLFSAWRQLSKRKKRREKRASLS
jgi:hypothetical protein